MEHSSVSVDKVCEEFLKFRFGDYDHDLRFIDGNQELFKNLSQMQSNSKRLLIK